MRFFFDRSPVAGVDELIQACGTSALQSPYRSTVPLLDVLRHQTDRLLAGLTSHLDQDAALAEVHLEYTVPPPKGTGTASHTDAMLCSDNWMLAVEAKWKEPRYETVEAWLEKGGQNRVDVLVGWLSLFDRAVGARVAPQEVAGLPYQLIHRAASACSSSRSPALAYLQFTESGQTGATWIKSDLQQLRELVGPPERFPLVLVDVAVEPTAAFNEIAQLPKGLPATGEVVMQALLRSQLLTCRQWTSDVL